MPSRNEKTPVKEVADRDFVRFLAADIVAKYNFDASRRKKAEGEASFRTIAEDLKIIVPTVSNAVHRIGGRKPSLEDAWARRWYNGSRDAMFAAAAEWVAANPTDELDAIEEAVGVVRRSRQSGTQVPQTAIDELTAAVVGLATKARERAPGSVDQTPPPRRSSRPKIPRSH